MWSTDATAVTDKNSRSIAAVGSVAEADALNLAYDFDSVSSSTPYARAALATKSNASLDLAIEFVDTYIEAMNC